MQITPFRIEEYMAKYEFAARYLLSSSDAESVTIADLLAFEPGAHDAFLKHWCGYTESPGAPWLREALVPIYSSIASNQLIVVSAAEEALIRPNTRALYINTPHNPTGLNLPPKTFRGVLDLATKHSISVFSDEVYR